MKKILLVFFFCIHYLNGQAQSELTLHNMPQVFQSSYTNLTALPDNKISIGLPVFLQKGFISSDQNSNLLFPGLSSTSFGLANSGFSLFKGAYQYQDSVQYVSPSEMLKQMAKNKNLFYTGASFDWGHLRVKVRNCFFSFSVRERIEVRFMYPKALFQLPIEGNYDLAGQELNLDNISINASHFREFGVGVTKPYKSWIFGARVKFLYGLSNIYTDKSKASIYFGKREDGYGPISVNSEAVIKTSVLTNNNDDLDENYFFNKANKGYAFDLGVSKKLNRKTTVSFNLNDVGFITWKTSPKQFVANGLYTFLGAPIKTSNRVDEKEYSFQSLIDSLDKSFKYSESTTSKYRTRLAAKLFLSGTFKICKRTSATLLFNTEFYKGPRFAGALSLSQGLGRVVSLISTYSIQNRSYNNLGFGIILKPGPFQFYIVGDNFMPLIKSLDRSDMKIDLSKVDFRVFTIRFGLNIVLGRILEADSQTYKKDRKFKFPFI